MAQVSKMKLRNKVFTIVLISLVVCAVIGMAIGYAITGADIIAWLYSRWAFWIYAGLGIFVFVWIALELYERIHRL